MNTIGIIGSGNMGSSLIRALRAKGLSIEVNDKDKAKLRKVCRQYSLRQAKSNIDLIKSSQVLIIAVKPQNIDSVLFEIDEALALATNKSQADKLIISIAAGVTTKYIEKVIGGRARVIRVMPNLAASIAESMSAIAKGKFAKKADLKIAQDIFKLVGETITLGEKHIDLVTAVSGSGPAYFFYLMESLIDAAVSNGVGREDAKKIVLQTALGAAGLALISQDPKELRRRVTSKKGITEAAVKIFEKRKLNKIIKDAVLAAKKRAKALSKG